MNIQNNGFLSIEELQDRYLRQNKGAVPAINTDGKSFQEILESRQAKGTEEVRFSKHAAGRLADRNIELTSSQLERLNEGAQKAQQKGVSESQLIVNQSASMVHIPNRPGVTAMNQGNAAQSIFTNIDGAVII